MTPQLKISKKKEERDLQTWVVPCLPPNPITKTLKQQQPQQ
jgi:hypothetical protein